MVSNDPYLLTIADTVAIMSDLHSMRENMDAHSRQLSSDLRHVGARVEQLSSDLESTWSDMEEGIAELTRVMEREPNVRRRSERLHLEFEE